MSNKNTANQENSSKLAETQTSALDNSAAANAGKKSTPKMPMRGGPGGHGPMGRGPMGGPGEKAKNFKGTLGKLLKYLKPYMFAIIISVIFAGVGTFLSIYSLDKMQDLTVLLTRKDFTGKDVAFAGIVIAAIALASAILTVIQNLITASVNAKICKKFRAQISHKTNKLPLSYFDSHIIGDILSRITNDVDSIALNLNSCVSTLITSIITIICIPVFMFKISWELTLIELATIPVTIIGTLIVVKLSQKYFVQQQNSLGRINGQIEEVYSGQLVVKVFNAQKRENAKFDQTNNILYKSGYKSQFISGMMMPFMNMVTNVSYALCCIVGVVLITNGTYAPIAFIASLPIFLVYIRQFNNPLQQLGNISSELQSTVAAAERVFEYLEETEQPDESTKTAQVQNFKGKVEFSHVRFGYNKDKVIISDLSLVAEPGQKVAIVGETGAGKTTIVNLLMRFYDYDSGSIKIDGTDILDMKREDVRKMFAMVLQDTWLFDGTIRDNLKYGRPDATDQEIIEACKASNIWHYVNTLPGGLDYQLTEKSSLSAGQKQLFTIARAMVQNAPMLILDEATSSVDTRTEEIIGQAMDKLMAGRTSFVIAHRLSTIKNSNLILLLKNGEVIEQGTHDELLKLNGEYASLYNSQFTANNSEVIE